MNGNSSKIIDNKALSKLSTVSWGIIANSLLIDTAHTRSFPSYNIVIGVFASIATSRTSWSLIVSCAIFSTITVLSIFIDVIYCFSWGREIIDGDSKSAKFSFIFFILNMFLKMGAIIYATAAQINASEEYEESMKKTPRKVNSERKDLSYKKDAVVRDRDDDLSEDSKDYVENDTEVFSSPYRKPELNRLNMPMPPFTPGVPGLISPYPRKLNHGITPPTPPPV